MFKTLLKKRTIRTKFCQKKVPGTNISSKQQYRIKCKNSLKSMLQILQIVNTSIEILFTCFCTSPSLNAILKFKDPSILQ